MLPSASKKPNTVPPDLPHELVATHILVHLPVRSLLRFRCVCKAWHDTIVDDSFIRAHLRVQNLSLVVAPLIRNSNDGSGTASNKDDKQVIITGLYRLDHMSQPGGDATLIHDMADYDPLLVFPSKRETHDLAHCDGLVLVPTDAMARVLNPATRRVLTLPLSPNSVRPRRLPPSIQGHQAFGFGHDPRSNSYKVARLFYRHYRDGNQYTLGMEVFTLKTNKHWRQTTAVPPQCPFIAGRTATFFRGSLLWLLTNTPAFIRFNLEDESFSITPPPQPLCSPEQGYEASSLAELRGELCLCVSDRRGAKYRSLEMWMCADLDNNNQPARWDRRYIIHGALFAGLPYFRLIAVLDEELVFRAGPVHLVLCGCQNGEAVLKNMVNLSYKRYQNADNDSRHGSMHVEYSDAIPYLASLLPL